MQSHTSIPKIHSQLSIFSKEILICKSINFLNYLGESISKTKA